jgi:hypothetical protein
MEGDGVRLRGGRWVEDSGVEPFENKKSYLKKERKEKKTHF